ncbi:MAG: hypothetical protein WA373_12320 [Burkholderiales bacterium]
MHAEQQRIEADFGFQMRIDDERGRRHLYQHPMIDAAKAGGVAKISPASACKLVADLERLGIPKVITGGKRGKTYLFAACLKLFKSQRRSPPAHTLFKGAGRGDPVSRVVNSRIDFPLRHSRGPL